MECSALEVLGLQPGASPEAIQAAFTRLAHAVHPDRLPQGSGLFRLILEARTELLGTSRLDLHWVYVAPGQFIAETALGMIQVRRYSRKVWYWRIPSVGGGNAESSEQAMHCAEARFKQFQDPS